MDVRAQTLSLLGLANKAKRCSFGHDASKIALRSGKAKLCFLCQDASPRLREEFVFLAQDTHTPLVHSGFLSAELKQATQRNAVVAVIEERGFAQKIAAAFAELGFVSEEIAHRKQE